MLTEIGIDSTLFRYLFSTDAYILQQMQSPALFHGEISVCRNANKVDSEPWPYARRVCILYSMLLTTHHILGEKQNLCCTSTLNHGVLCTHGLLP